MKTVFILLAILFSSTLLFNSCSGDEYNENIFKKDSHGAPGKVLIVLDKKYWGGTLEKTIIERLEKEITTLPQPEKMFSVEIAPHKSFIKGLKTLHTIVVFDIGSKANNRNARLEEPSYDIWAKNQVIYKFRASSQKSATQLFLQEIDALVDELNESCRKKLMSEYEFSGSSAIVSALSSMQKLSLTVPSGFSVLENHKDFTWLKRYRTKSDAGQEHEIQQGIFIYSYPYTNDSTFTLDFQIAKRDSVLKAMVPGPTEDSYMATETRMGMKPEFSQKMINGLYVFEMRGLWMVEGDLMGGPFMSISMFDEPNNRIVTIEGYVWAPHFAKREYLREMEAMIYSYQFLE